MVNKNYPADFKADAVALYRSRPGTSIGQIAVDLGVDRETLRRWIRADDQVRGPGSPGTSPAGPVPTGPSLAGSVEDENAALRRRVRELEEERDILRKAARYFAGETRW
jgi:transposase